MAFVFFILILQVITTLILNQKDVNGGVYPYFFKGLLTEMTNINSLISLAFLYVYKTVSNLKKKSENRLFESVWGDLGYSLVGGVLNPRITQTRHDREHL